MIDVVRGHEVDFEIQTCCQVPLVLVGVVHRLNLHVITLTPHELVPLPKSLHESNQIADLLVPEKGT